MTKRVATVNLKKSESNLATGIVLIFIANVINLLFSIGTNLILPKFLSVESYAAIKTYQLYITYVGVLHFGFNDGMYLKYGGKSFDELNKSDVLNNLSTLRIFQVVVTVICIGVSVALKDAVLLMASIVIFPMNLKAYYQSLYQAIGEFGIYSKIMNTVTGVTFFINAILVFFFKTDNYIYYLILYVALNFVIWIALEFLFQKKAGCHIRWMVFDWKELVNQIKAGVLIMLGNFSDSIMTSMDRWFVKIFVGTVAFAQYAFAVSMEHFLSVAVSPLSITLYNYLFKNIPNYKLKKLRGAILIFSAFLVCSAFPVVFILEHFMTNYVDAIHVLILLFASQIFFTVVKCIYVNLYKANKMQTKYFQRWISVIAVAFISNIMAYFLVKTKEAFAIATLVSAMYWFVMSTIDFKEISYSIKEITYLIVETVCFIFCGYIFNSVVGFVAYLFLTVLITIVLMNDSVIYMLKLISVIAKKKNDNEIEEG